MLAVGLALLAAEPTVRQAELERLAVAVRDADTPAYTNLCRVADGRARYDRSAGRLIAVLPRLKTMIGAKPLYRIFVAEVPKLDVHAVPPELCPAPPVATADDEARMVRFETAVTALTTTLATP